MTLRRVSCLREQLCRPCVNTPDIQNYFLENFEKGVKDEFDKEFEDLPGRSRVEMAAKLWER